jgi:hypothetical protein
MIFKQVLGAVSALVVMLVAGSAASAGIVVHRVGDQDFAVGAGPLPVALVKAAGADEAFPFNGTVFGDDRGPRDFGTVRFTYAFAPTTSPDDGILTLGLIGLDSMPHERATVKFWLDGVEQPNGPFTGMSSPLFRSSASVVSVPVPSSLLADGTLEVMVKTYRASPGFAGNAIEADFSTLAVVYPEPVAGSGNGAGDESNGGGGTSTGGTGRPGPPATVPLPPGLLMGLGGLLLAKIARHNSAR